MSPEEIVPGLYQLSLRAVNAFLLRDGEDLVLIDTGTPGDAEAILTAIRSLDHRPTDVRHILVTHCHRDHAGGLAALKDATGAPAGMHPLDAALVRDGRARRPWEVTPGVLNRFLYWIYVRGTPTTLPPTEVERAIEGGAELPLAGGLRALHVPGHCAGQLAFLWPRHGGVLLAADTAVHYWGLRWSLVYEDRAQGRESLQTLAHLDFERAVFGHGSPIEQNAAQRFRERFGRTEPPRSSS